MHAEAITYSLPNADIILYPTFFSPEESTYLFKNLVEKIDWQHYQIRIFGKLIDQPRLTAYYGEKDKSYTYSGLQLIANPWNEELLLIKKKIAEVEQMNFNSVLLNYYRTGNDSMGWHSDDEKSLGRNPAIASVSFGETRLFQLKHRLQKDIPKVEIPLAPGSLLVMKGETQHFWQHQIPKSPKQTAPRINLTFRNIIS